MVKRSRSYASDIGDAVKDFESLRLLLRADEVKNST